MNLSVLIKELDELEKRYQAWVKPINKVIRECSSKINRDGYTRDDFERGLNEIREKQRSKYDPCQEMHKLLLQLCPIYLEASPQQRAEIRIAVSDKNGILGALLGYVYTSAKQVRSDPDKKWLRWGLAAVSIENCSQDYRDVLLALAELYVAAEEVGFDPKPDFKAVSKLSSRETPRGGLTPVSKMLANFHNYAVLKERRCLFRHVIRQIQNVFQDHSTLRRK
jgi:hypothetical protein